MKPRYRHPPSRWARSVVPRLLAVALLVAAASMAACDGSGGGGGSDSEAPSDSATSIRPGCFKGGGTPQLDFSQPWKAGDWTWNDPHVLKVGGKYWMYASSTEWFDFPVRLYRLVSTDAKHWTLNPDGTNVTAAVFDVGGSGAWDEGGVETPAVVKFGGVYYLFYTGYEPPYPGEPDHDVYTYQVGEASSTDGKTFTRVGTGLIVSAGDYEDGDGDPGTHFTAYIVGEPGPVVFKGKIYLYFTAAGDDPILGNTQVIALTTSADGTTWSAPRVAMRLETRQYPQEEYWYGYSTPNAIVIDGEVHLFVDVAQQPSGLPWKQRRLHHARSANGKTGWKQDSDPIRRASDYDWTLDEIRSPDALLDEGVLRLWFAGNNALTFGADPMHFGIGMLTCDLDE